jgi:2-polyprenyl-3-methyl-5-hydroxy-6-metoxy-1,4-benzoquinol methylase
MQSNKPLCNLCGSDKVNHLSTFKEEQLYKCQNCHLVFKWPLPKNDIVTNQVEKHYTEADPHQSVALAKNRFFKKLLDTLDNKCTSEEKTLLDVGCGYGYFMQLASERGWKAHGVEIMEKGCLYIKEKLNLPVCKGDLMEADYAPQSFDVVSLLDVLVMCPDPSLTLKQAALLLKNKGLVVIRLRNYYFQRLIHLIYHYGGWLFSLWKISNPSVFHLYSFSPSTIKKMLLKAGFHNIKINNSYLTTGDPYGIVKSSILAKIIKAKIYYSAQIVYYLTFGKIILGPSLLVTAKKIGQ